MNHLLSVKEIQALGFTWPARPIIAEKLAMVDGKIDLETTIENLESSLNYYKKWHEEAFEFKERHGVRYSDFTDLHGEYMGRINALNDAIFKLKCIISTTLGFTGPARPIIGKNLVIVDGKIDLETTIENLESSLNYYREWQYAACDFKERHGVQYTDLFNDAIFELKKIISASK